MAVGKEAYTVSFKVDAMFDIAVIGEAAIEETGKASRNSMAVL